MKLKHEQNKDIFTINLKNVTAILNKKQINIFKLKICSIDLFME